MYATGSVATLQAAIQGQPGKPGNPGISPSPKYSAAAINTGGTTNYPSPIPLDTTGMSGPDKVFYIGKALVETAKAQGFKGDLKVLKATMLDVAQTAYRNSLPSIEGDALALLASLHLGPVLTSVAELVPPTIEAKAEAAVAGALG